MKSNTARWIFQGCADPVFVLDAQGEILESNTALMALVAPGAAASPDGPLAWGQLVAPDDLGGIHAAIKACQEQQPHGPVRARLVTPAGLPWYTFQFSLLRNSHDKIEGMLAIGRLVPAPRKRHADPALAAAALWQAQEELRQRVERIVHFYTRLHSMPEDPRAFGDGLCQLLAQLYQPLLACLALGQPPHVAFQSRGPLPAGALTAGGTPALTEQLGAMVQGRALFYTKDAARDPDLAADPLLRLLGIQTCLGVPLREASGRARGTLFLLDDRAVDFDEADLELLTGVAGVVAEKLKRSELRERQRQGEENFRHQQKMEVAGQLAGGVAHQFNNALSGIMGLSSYLRARVPEESELHKPLALIEQAAVQASDLTRRLALFSPHPPLNKQVVSLPALVREVAAGLRMSAGHAVIQVDTPAESLAIEADPDLIQQMIMQVGLNALESMADQPGVLSLSVGRHDPETGSLSQPGTSGRFLGLVIRDTGPGMSEAVRQQIFEPYFTTKCGSRGCGLGMAMVYGIVTAHGGHIAVDSRPGAGTVVRITLPLYQAVPTSLPAATTARSRTILAIDDEAIVGEMVQQIAASQGYQTLCSNSGADGLRLMQEHRGKVDLVLLDLRMPGMDGEQTYNELRKIDPGVPVLLTTGFATEAQCHRLIAAGACGLVRKPYKSHVLLETIQHVFEQPAPACAAC